MGKICVCLQTEWSLFITNFKKYDVNVCISRFKLELYAHVTPTISSSVCFELEATKYRKQNHD